MPDDQQANDDGIVHYEGGIPIFNTRLDKLENDAREAKDRDDKYKQEQLKLNRRLVWFTALLAVVGLIGSAISGYQAHVAKINANAAGDNAKAAQGMVEEMKKSGTDTHELAVQAGKQAEAALAQVKQLEISVKESHAFTVIARDTLKATKQNFVLSERPYIWVKYHPIQLEVGKVVRWEVDFVNFGRSPAFHMKTCAMLITAQDAMTDATKDKLLERCRYNSETIVPPGGSVFSGGYGDLLLTPQELSFLKNADFRVVLMTRATYSDNSDHPYETVSCSTLLATGAEMNCPKANEIH